jgi:hypothetical protein
VTWWREGEAGLPFQPALCHFHQSALIVYKMKPKPTQIVLREAMRPGDHSHRCCSSHYCFLLLAVLSLLLPIVLLRSPHRSWQEALSRFPPGPWRLPVIGSLHHLITNEAAHAPDHGGPRAPVQHPRQVPLQRGEVPAVVISSHDVAREVLKTHDAAFATRSMLLSIRATTQRGWASPSC